MIDKYLKKRAILVMLIGLVMLSFAFPRYNAYASVQEKVFNYFYRNEKIDDPLIENIVNDININGIKISGFTDKKFSSKEEEARYKTAIVVQQIQDLFSAIGKSGDLVEAGKTIAKAKEFLSNNMNNAVKKVDSKIDKAGGINNAKFDFDDWTILGLDIGNFLVKTFGSIDTKKVENAQKTLDQLKRETYKELGLDKLPNNLLKDIFIFPESEAEMLRTVASMDKYTKDFFDKTGSYLAFSAQLTPKIKEIMQKANISDVRDLAKIYEANKGKIKDIKDLESLASRMQTKREDIKKFLEAHLVPSSNSKSNQNQPYMSYDKYTELLLLAGLIPGDMAGADISKSFVWDSPTNYQKFLDMLKDYEKEFGVSLQQMSSDIEDRYFFYQNEKGNKDNLKLVDTKKMETHTFISRVEFTITKKEGSIGQMTVAPQQILNELANKFSPTFSKAYKDATGGKNSVPTPKIIKKTANVMIVEVNFEEGIKAARKGTTYYDAVRNYWSKINGKHNRKSLDYASKTNGFIPTMAFSRVGEPGVYTIEATVYAKRFYDDFDYYTSYSNCKEIDTDGDGIKEHKHGKTKKLPYYPYREQLITDKRTGHQKVKANDTQGVEPTIITPERIIGQVVWEVKVGTKVKNGVQLVIPPEGVSSSNLTTKIFLSK